MKVVGVIPARFESSRFPGKPLVKIGGQSMIRRVYQQVSKAGFDHVLVATDDTRIMAEVESFGGKAVMTPSSLPNGTARCLDALNKSGLSVDLLVNVQGDEPFTDPNDLRKLPELFNPTTSIATLAHPITDAEDLLSPNVVKVIFDQERRAMYFSRQAIPFQRDIELSQWLKKTDYYQHLGIYAFRASQLEELINLPISPLEESEKLEQLRWLDHGYTIRVGLARHKSIGIDTPEDVALAERLLTK